MRCYALGEYLVTDNVAWTSSLYRRIAAGRFPPPVHLGGLACAWSRVALQMWIADPENYHAPETRRSEVSRPRGRPRKYALT
jgi:hypothetical protein